LGGAPLQGMKHTRECFLPSKSRNYYAWILLFRRAFLNNSAARVVSENFAAGESAGEGALGPRIAHRGRPQVIGFPKKLMRVK